MRRVKKDIAVETHREGIKCHLNIIEVWFLSVGTLKESKHYILKYHPNFPKSQVVMVSYINEVTMESRRSPFTSYQSTHVRIQFKAPAGPIQRGEGRRREAILVFLKRHKRAEFLPHVSLKAYIFQAPESINACIILWIPLFRAAKWLGHPCMKPISNSQSKTHPGTTYRSWNGSYLWPLETCTCANEQVEQISA